VTCYAAAAGIPVMLASFPHQQIEPGSPPAVLGQAAARLHLNRPLRPQVARAAATWPDTKGAEMAAQVTSVPGQAAQLIRTAMYRLLHLPEPTDPPPVRPVPRPAGIPTGQVAA
jgi:hypothetical protein